MMAFCEQNLQLLGVGQTGIDTLQQCIVITAIPVTALMLPTLITGPLAARRLLHVSDSPPPTT